MRAVSFKLIFRSWLRNKTFAVIAILSLAVGIACTNLLAAFVIHEYNIEPDNPNKDRIVATKRTAMSNGVSNFSVPFRELTAQVLDNVPELELSCKVNSPLNLTYCKVGENFFTDFKLLEADTTFFQFFPQKIIRGSMEDALVGPDRIVLSESFAKRLFGRNDPIGQTVLIELRASGIPDRQKEGLLAFTVAAVAKENTQAAFSFDAIYFHQPALGTNFFMLKDNVSIAELQARTENLILKSSRMNGAESKFEFFSMQEAGFAAATYRSDILKQPNSNLLLIALFSAILILAIACFNYVNLSFSRVFKQLYSIHIQKLMGAGSRQLSMQLFADTFMTVGLGFLIAQLIQFDLLGVMNRIMSVQVPTSFLYSSQVLPITFVFILILACIPALYMSRRLPELSISVYNNFYRGKARRRIITSLAVMQFTISFILIIGSFSVRQQVSVLYDKADNFKNMYSFSVGDFKTSMLPLKERIALIPGIQSAALLGVQYNHILGGEISDTYSVENGDENLMEVMGFKILQGLPWKEAIELYPNPVYLNRTWAQSLFPDGNIPIGHHITEYEPKLKEGSLLEDDPVIAGVVEDFLKQYMGALENPIDKAAIKYARDGILLNVRVDPAQASAVISQIYQEWNKLHPGEYLRHESKYERLINRNKKVIELSDLLLMYSIISILLTCFGLFGIALYATEQRTKEIGIRKVNGSTSWQIMQLLNRQFINWIGIAFVISAPIIWWLIRRWMESFVYRAEFSIWTYVLSLLIVIAITLLTVSWHSYKAASGNPVKALRSE